ncbi:MAG TPA: dTDP-4-dehydrorhamnose reductase [Candidatus Polarisedimenticolaceae bacterium]|nr:dTDP-4-dehydrorhamnose reductase [Candidatus Polarisedimenticolaceae bacterium]
MSETILVLGGSGQLGRALLDELTRRGRSFVAPRREQLDLQATAEIAGAVAALRPTIVINAAAFTDVVAAERPEQRAAAFALNRDAVAALAAGCERCAALLVHVSTDYVFDGRQQRPYRESDPVGPLQVYGRSKLEGERAALGGSPRALVVRTSTLFGPGPRARPHYVDAVLRQARAGGRLELVARPIASPTYAPHLAAGLLELLRVGVAGLVHLANRGACSRIELAREAIARAGLASRVELSERTEPDETLPRPAYSALDTSLFTALAGQPLPAWEQAVDEYVAGLAR